MLSFLPTGKAEDVAEFFIADIGKCFVSELTQSVVKKLGINHETTSSYQPQANGAVERMNHTLAAML